VGPDRCLLGTECPGTGSAGDPATRRGVAVLRHPVDCFDWLSPADWALIFQGNARRLFRLAS
jgi:hypothetical protein